jgi:hypothetical protein
VAHLFAVRVLAQLHQEVQLAKAMGISLDNLSSDKASREQVGGRDRLRSTGDASVTASYCAPLVTAHGAHPDIGSTTGQLYRLRGSLRGHGLAWAHAWSAGHPPGGRTRRRKQPLPPPSACCTCLRSNAQPYPSHRRSVARLTEGAARGPAVQPEHLLAPRRRRARLLHARVGGRVPHSFTYKSFTYKPLLIAMGNIRSYRSWRRRRRESAARPKMCARALTRVACPYPA